jgi:hypothetical protein
VSEKRTLGWNAISQLGDSIAVTFGQYGVRRRSQSAENAGGGRNPPILDRRFYLPIRDDAQLKPRSTREGKLASIGVNQQARGCAAAGKHHTGNLSGMRHRAFRSGGMSTAGDRRSAVAGHLHLAVFIGVNSRAETWSRARGRAASR